MSSIATFQPNQLALIQRTVAKDCNATEFDLFIELCKARGLNPLLRHAFAQVYNKDSKPKTNREGKILAPAKERQLVIVVSREGQRALAERTKAYRPDERAPRFEFGDKDEALNPAGLISAEVSVYKHAHGEWFPVTEVAYWEEYAPISEAWEGKGDDRRPSGKFELQRGKDGWRKMPRIMLAKCAEMAALRKAFPDSFSGLYGEEEMHRGEALDLTPSEWAEKAGQDERLKLIGGNASVIIDWMDGQGLCKVKDGDMFDRAAAFLRTCQGDPKRATSWKEQNRHGLQEFWARCKADALELKKLLEQSEAQPLPPDPQLDLIEAIKAKA